MRDHAVERAGRVYKLLVETARIGEPCPPNHVLRERFGMSSQQVSDTLNFLICNGMVEVERPHRTRRIIVICATGHRTA